MLQRPTALEVSTPSLTDLSQAAFSRFLAGAPNDAGLVVKVDAHRWAKDVQPESDHEPKAAFLSMRDAVRALPYAQRGILLKTCVDEKGREWFVRSYANRHVYILAWLHLAREGEEI